MEKKWNWKENCFLLLILQSDSILLICSVLYHSLDSPVFSLHAVLCLPSLVLSLLLCPSCLSHLGRNPRAMGYVVHGVCWMLYSPKDNSENRLEEPVHSWMLYSPEKLRKQTGGTCPHFQLSFSPWHWPEHASVRAWVSSRYSG